MSYIKYIAAVIPAIAIPLSMSAYKYINSKKEQIIKMEPVSGCKYKNYGDNKNCGKELEREHNEYCKDHTCKYDGCTKGIYAYSHPSRKGYCIDHNFFCEKCKKLIMIHEGSLCQFCIEPLFKDVYENVDLEIKYKCWISDHDGYCSGPEDWVENEEIVSVPFKLPKYFTKSDLVYENNRITIDMKNIKVINLFSFVDDYKLLSQFSYCGCSLKYEIYDINITGDVDKYIVDNNIDELP